MEKDKFVLGEGVPKSRNELINMQKIMVYHYLHHLLS
jgi:hypothetical protein